MTDIRFGTDGWRGIIADDVTFANVRLVARAIALTVRAERAGGRARLLVGHDTRFLSGEFARAAAEAMAAEGVDVELTSGFAPTPAFSYAVVNRGADGAVVITASHNPPEYSGVKFKSSFGGSAPIEFTRRVEETIRQLQNAECGMRNAEWESRNAEWESRNAEWESRNAEWESRNAENRRGAEGQGRTGDRERGRSGEGENRRTGAGEQGGRGAELPSADHELSAMSHEPRVAENRGGAEAQGRTGEDGKFEIRNSKFEIPTFDAREPWLDRLEELVDLRRIGSSGLHVALDVMYGAGQGLLAARLRRAGCEVKELHAAVNPAFGGLHPEPVPAHMGDLIDFMKTWQASPRAGFAFDGDSDRLGPVDEDGRVITPHETLALLLRHLARNRGWRGPVVKSVNIGRMVEAEAAALGLPVIVTPVGFKHIAEAILAHDALVGGEESGGFAVRGHIPERDPGLVSLLLLECMAMTGKSLGTLVREMEADYGPHRYGRIDLRLATLAQRDEVVASVMRRPPDSLLSQPLRHVETLDGVKLTLDNGSWIMLRASGTEPLLRIYAEAPTDADVEALLAWGRGRAEGGSREGQGTGDDQ